MITGIFVYERAAVDLGTHESDLKLETMGEPIDRARTLVPSSSLSPGVYRVLSREPLAVKVAGGAVDVIQAKDKDDWPTPPPGRVADILKLKNDDVTAFFKVAKSVSSRMKRALVIGSQVGSLKGVVNDAQAMKALLESRGFDVDFRVGGDASRQGILAGYKRLTEESASNDVAVVYYCGHGAYASLSDATLSSWQHIVPTDYEDSAADDWRGITAWELSLLQQELTAKTRNVTVILDCCNSAQMSRDPAVADAIPRALPHPNEHGFRAHITALRAEHRAAFAALDPRGNPDAVRLVACAQTESAYECPNADGVYRGVFTEALVDVMEAAGRAPITWKAVGEAARARVLKRFPTQRPELEGPIRRRVFDLDEENEVGATAIRLVDDRYVLAAGRLAGASVGDVYAVMPMGTLAYDKTKALGEVEVVEVFALTSHAKRTVQAASFADDAVAIPIRKQAPKRLVAVEAPEPDRATIAKVIDATRTMRVAEPGEAGAVATLRLADGKLTIADAKGPLFAPAAFPDTLDGVARNVANLGVAQAVRALAGEAGVSADDVAIELGVVSNGAMSALPDDGSSLGLRDRIYFKLTNKAAGKRHFHVFDLGLRGQISSLSAFAPSGIGVDAGKSYVLAGAAGELVGFELGWPEGMVTDVPRVEDLLVIVTREPASLLGLETTEASMRGDCQRSATSSALEDLLAQVHDGQSREVRKAKPADGYYAKRLSFVLHPREVAMGGLAFDIDENPTGLGGARSADAWIARGASTSHGDAPKKIAVRLGDLVVLNNRALFRADVRIDAVICTRSGDRKPVTWTQRYERIADGEALSLQNPVLFHGPVKDFVDIALFVSRDAKASLDLAALFEQQANSVEFKDASAALLIAAGAATATPWVTAVGASAVLARMAYQLVRGVAGNSIGLYRTSFLASERFGTGRHPAEGLYRAQDFSFSLSIEAV